MADKQIVFFDGLCNLCSSAVQIIIKHDKKKQFLFASLQGSTAAEMVPAHLSKSQGIDSILYFENEQFYLKSTAALKIAKHLAFPMNLNYGFIIVPGFIRNWVYDLIARNRYRWFGKKEECWLPTPELKERFLP